MAESNLLTGTGLLMQMQAEQASDRFAKWWKAEATAEERDFVRRYAQAEAQKIRALYDYLSALNDPEA